MIDPGLRVDPNLPVRGWGACPIGFGRIDCGGSWGRALGRRGSDIRGNGFRLPHTLMRGDRCGWTLAFETQLVELKPSIRRFRVRVSRRL